MGRREMTKKVNRIKTTSNESEIFTSLKKLVELSRELRNTMIEYDRLQSQGVVTPEDVHVRLESSKKPSLTS